VRYAALPPRHAGNVLEHVRFADRIFGRFIGGKIVDSLIMGAIAMVGLRLLNMPYAVLMSVIIGVTNIVPFFGPIVGGIICVFITLIVDPMKALYLGVFVLVLQQVDGNIIGPGILGETTGLSSFWVLFSILLFGGLWGVVGMVIGVPLFAVIYSMVGTWANNRLQKKNLSTQTTSYLDMDPAGLDEGSYLE
jgi:predicted PurR-regulated permease PerM